MRLFWQIESRWPAQPVYPHLARRRIFKNASANTPWQFKCRGCVKTLDAPSGTLHARTQMRSKWLTQPAALHDGLSPNQVAGRLINTGQNESTTFRGYHRFLAGSKTVSALLLAGVAQADETYSLHSAKGQWKLECKRRRRGSKTAKHYASKEQILVLIAHDRISSSPSIIFNSIANTGIAATLKPILLPPDIILRVENCIALTAVARNLGGRVPCNRCCCLPARRGRLVRTAFCTQLRAWLRRFKCVNSATSAGLASARNPRRCSRLRPPL